MNAIQERPTIAPGGPGPKEEVKTAHTVASVVYAGPEAVERRLEELDREWTVGRVVKVVSALGIFLGLGLAVFVHPAWIALPTVIGLLLVQHAVSRWSLLTALIRTTGLRRGKDVEHERIALKALRGDFRHLPTLLDRADEEALDRLAGEGGIAQAPEVPQTDSHEAAHQVLETLKH